MTTFINDINKKFKQGDILVKIIFINIFIFLSVRIVSILLKLFQAGSMDLSLYLALPSSPQELMAQPWTILTYMFVHSGIFHILFNMLVFYWFGRLYLRYFSGRQLLGLYLLGGFSGALFYILAFNLIPFYAQMGTSVLVGASAAVMAIVFGISLYRRDLTMHLLFIGPVKIFYIALVMFVIDFISLDGKGNPGGHLAHIGGALAGYLFAITIKKGTDLTAWLNRLVDLFVNLYSRIFRRNKAKMKVKYSKRDADYRYNERKQGQETEIDRILDKIKQSGYDSLNMEEKKSLFDASKK